VAHVLVPAADALDQNEPVTFVFTTEDPKVGT